MLILNQNRSHRSHHRIASYPSPRPKRPQAVASDQVQLSGLSPTGAWGKAKALGLGAALGFSVGVLAMTGPVGFLGGIALGTAVTAARRIDTGDSAIKSAQTGLLFSTLSAAVGATLGLPGALAGALFYGARAALGAS